MFLNSHHMESMPMKPLRTLTHAIALASLMTAASFSVQAQDILISGTAIEDDVVTKVLAIDMDKRLVTVAGPNDTQVPIQVSEQAKALGNLKVGDDVNVHVTRSVATVLDTNVGGEPGASKEAGVIRATKENPNPGGEAFRQIKITSKITKIDLKSHEVTLMPPEGPQKVVKVEDPELQARMKNLKVGQTVDIVFTDVLKITTKH
jgi:Cu/Ag efflux protein CusF